MPAKIVQNIKNSNLIPAIKRKYHIKIKRKNTNKTVVLSGTARSGTTWLAQTLNYDNRFKFIFEPFDDRVKYPNRIILENHYIQENETNKSYVESINHIITGKIRNISMDEYNERLFYDNILVKMTKGNFLLKWLHNLYPDLKIIYIMRHTFSRECQIC
ncbi:MAG: sulfotransferase [Candidatus Heimdallarchaeota archaeon]|nr:sulfotransferase [Candidatus Heimdallarchaeota archaeon]MCK4612648.1 sulfotransferase [Candidatus Heimdallarchaeota archaeon]